MSEALEYSKLKLELGNLSFPQLEALRVVCGKGFQNCSSFPCSHAVRSWPGCYDFLFLNFLYFKMDPL